MSAGPLSQKLFAEARTLMPGGVNSPVRAFDAVGGTPVYFARGEGAYLHDVDGRRYADFCCSWGPLILGHARKEVVDAVVKAASKGLSFGACCPAEPEMARLLREAIPDLESFRMTSSGTEAVMTALRLARGATGRSKIIKFEGCYHGHSDSMLVSAGSGLLTGGVSSSKGVPPEIAAETIVVPYNDPEAVAKAARAAKDAGTPVAGMIVEPVAGNMGLVEPLPGFLEALRSICDEHGAKLIFDEVINGFRFGPTSYGTLCGVRPDIATFGKIVGGGMPLGCVAGSKELMELLAPCGPVYQAGTLSGNPVALAAGIATLQILRSENPYPALAEKGARIAKALNGFAVENSLPVHCAAKGGVFTVFFTAAKAPLRNLAEVKSCAPALYSKFFNAMLAKGFYLPPAQFELAFVSAAHSDGLIGEFIEAAKTSLLETFER
jgi:glutamate-1-semialdehyde 2,1-aminomutase